MSAKEQAKKSSKFKQLGKIFPRFNRNDKEIEVTHSTSNQWLTERPLKGEGGVVTRLYRETTKCARITDKW